MARSAKRRETRRRRGLAAMAGSAILANPIAVGGTTAFLVAFTFISANALWYQPHKHPNAFLYGPPEPPPAAEQGEQPRETSIRIEREADVEEAAKRAADRALAGDRRVADVQAELAGRGLYDGPIDGLEGPRTNAALAEWRKLAGLPEGGGVDEALTASLGLDGRQGADGRRDTAQPAVSIEELIEAPLPTPRADATTTASVDTKGDPLIRQVQAGLKAFGNDGIELDGVVGPRTRAAIREFQSLFGLEETGEADEALLAKMREVGLTN
ncbi:MAG: peptidoglycan-binding protein [Rhizobiaceae bacterium]|nr:peptidoglycan-binding protein [Rhizobiaceae bacterium]MCV0405514.1 peptidoglycan-binding protein [Rhizobiaceae bacterium]